MNNHFSRFAFNYNSKYLLRVPVLVALITLVRISPLLYVWIFLTEHVTGIFPD